MNADPSALLTGSDFAAFATFGQLFLVLVFCGYIIYSIVLFYHWFSYGTDYRTNVISLLVYLGATIPLILFAVYSFSQAAYVV